ncbi:MAG: hypothetical protein EOP48_12190 [Sphingobacteriales bacterium]|nr:MAG: hypothetical protein EOP48_12190 [Sphingobacteriales bacterium]
MAEKLEQAGVGVSYFSLLKRGLDLEMPDGRLIKNAEFTIDPEPVKSYGYCSDTLYDENYFDAIKECDTLYHEATFLHEMLERANQTHHTTAFQAAEVARITRARKLLIGHFSSRYKTLQPFLDEARSVFPDTDLAVEGRTFAI